jgi:hypothetical protein
MSIGFVVAIVIAFKNKEGFIPQPNFYDYLILGIAGCTLGLTIGSFIVIALIFL